MITSTLRRQVTIASSRLYSASTSLEIVKHQTDDFESEFKKHHISTNFFQRSLLSVGAAATALLDPHRADMVACLGETSGYAASNYILNKMKNSPEGLQILQDRARINSKTVDLTELKKLPEGTLGKVYCNFLDENDVTPDSRLMVQFVDDIELAYVIQRYREVHDLIHALLGMKTNMLGEVAVKWVEAIQTKLPMCIGAALFGPLRLKPKQRTQYMNYYLPWAIETGLNSNFLLNVYFEKRWEQPLIEIHKELGIRLLEIPKK